MGNETIAGALVRSRRARLDLSQREAARLCGLPQSMLSRIESGQTQPSIPTLQGVLSGLGAELHLELRTSDGGEGRGEKARSLWLSRAVVGELVRDPERTIGIAGDNLERWREIHAADAAILIALDRWGEILDAGVEAIVATLTGLSEDAEDLRQNAPFAGVLSEQQRDQVLAAFADFWRTAAAGQDGMDVYGSAPSYKPIAIRR